MLEVRDITKIYNPGTLTEQRLFEHFSLTVDEGQFVAIVGGTGTGKSTLVNLIPRFYDVSGGAVLRFLPCPNLPLGRAFSRKPS